MRNRVVAAIAAVAYVSALTAVATIIVVDEKDDVVEIHGMK